MKNYRILKPFAEGQNVGDELMFRNGIYSYQEEAANPWVLMPHDIALLLHAGFIEEVNGEWVPKKGDYYWYIANEGDIRRYIWEYDSIDNEIKNFLGVYPSEAAATKARGEIRELVKKYKEKGV